MKPLGNISLTSPSLHFGGSNKKSNRKPTTLPKDGAAGTPIVSTFLRTRGMSFNLGKLIRQKFPNGVKILGLGSGDFRMPLGIALGLAHSGDKAKEKFQLLELPKQFPITNIELDHGQVGRFEKFKRNGIFSPNPAEVENINTHPGALRVLGRHAKQENGRYEFPDYVRQAIGKVKKADMFNELTEIYGLAQKDRTPIVIVAANSIGHHGPKMKPVVTSGQLTMDVTDPSPTYSKAVEQLKSMPRGTIVGIGRCEFPVMLHVSLLEDNAYRTILDPQLRTDRHTDLSNLFRLPGGYQNPGITLDPVDSMKNSLPLAFEKT